MYAAYPILWLNSYSIRRARMDWCLSAVVRACSDSLRVVAYTDGSWLAEPLVHAHGVLVCVVQQVSTYDCQI